MSLVIEVFSEHPIGTPWHPAYTSLTKRPLQKGDRVILDGGRGGDEQGAYYYYQSHGVPLPAVKGKISYKNRQIVYASDIVIIGEIYSHPELFLNQPLVCVSDEHDQKIKVGEIITITDPGAKIVNNGKGHVINTLEAVQYPYNFLIYCYAFVDTQTTTLTCTCTSLDLLWNGCRCGYFKNRLVKKIELRDI